MKFRIYYQVLIAGISIMAFSSCARNLDLPVLLKNGEVSKQQKTDEAEALFAKATQKFKAEKYSSAARSFRKYYSRFPLSENAAEAIYMRGQSLEKKKDIVIAFSEYQKIIDRYASSGFYQKALDEQIRISNLAFDKKLKEHFIFLSADISESQTITFLDAVIANAPNSGSAVKAQNLIAGIHAKSNDTDSAIRAYEKLVFNYPSTPEAAEAQYKIGELYIMAAEGGNQDLANVKSARKAFHDLVNLYPESENVAKAKEGIKKLDSQEIRRSLATAKFYEDKRDYKPARVYYELVLNSPLASSALKDEASKAMARIEKL